MAEWNISDGAHIYWEGIIILTDDKAFDLEDLSTREFIEGFPPKGHF